MVQELGEEATLNAMQSDLQTIMSSIYKKSPKSYRTKPVKRKYCFDLDIPKGLNTCLKVKYPFQFPQIPFEQHTQSIKYILGSSYSAQELLILKKKVRGPCWINFLNLKTPEHKLSYCTYEYEIPSMEFMKVDKDKAHIPNLKLLSLSCAFAKNQETGV